MAAHSISTTRVRAAAIAAGALVVAALCVGLWFASIHNVAQDVFEDYRAEVWMIARPEVRAPAPQRQTAPLEGPRVMAPSAQPNADPVLAQMLNCFNPRGRERNERCPPAQQRAPDWRTRGQLPVGRDFVTAPPIDFSAGLSRGEQLAGLQHEPPCSIDGRAASACARLPPPPPPSRTAVEICEAAGLGPCHPPPPPDQR